MHEPAGVLTRDPARAGNGDAAVQRDRGLVGDERAPLRDPGAPGLVLASRLDAVGELDRDALRPRAAPGRPGLGVRVARAGDDTRDPGCEHGVDARRRRAVVRAGLHRHVERRAARPLAGGLERHDLSVPARRPRSRPRRRSRRPRRRRRRPSAWDRPCPALRLRARAPAANSCQGFYQAAIRLRQVLAREDAAADDEQVRARLVHAA